MAQAEDAATTSWAAGSAALLLGPAVFVAILLSPLPLERPAHRLAALVGLVMAWWITEAIPLAATALLIPALASALGIAKARDAFGPFSDPVLFLFLGSFLLAEALHVHGLDRRLALWILSLPGTSSATWRVRLAAGLITAGLSMWISNTAAAAMMLPIALGLVRALASAGVSESPRGLLMIVGIAASLGGVATPVGTPPNLIALGFLERLGGPRLDFLTFMSIGVPLSLSLLAVTSLAVHRMVPPASGTADLAAFVKGERAQLSPWGAGQWACVSCFGFAVVFWLLPGLVAVGGLQKTTLGSLSASLEESVVAVLAGGLLFLLPGGGDRRALTWSEASRIDWGTLLLFGGGLSLGKLMFDTGLAEVVGRAVLAATGVDSLWGLTALALALTIVLTEAASNTATVSMLAPLVMALARELGVPVVPPLLAVAFGASMGFMFPVGTPPNALVYGTGLVPLHAMMRIGVIVDCLSFFVILAVLRLLCPVLGLS